MTDDALDAHGAAATILRIAHLDAALDGLGFPRPGFDASARIFAARRRSISVRVEVDAGFRRKLGAELIGEHARSDFIDRAFRQVAKLEGPEGDADQAAHLDSEMLQHAFDLANTCLRADPW